MKKQRYLLLTLFFLSIAFTSNGYTQEDWWKEKKHKTEESRKKSELCKKTFKEINNGFSASSVSLISQFFYGDVFLDIISFEKGYYSPSQAEFILSDFMDYFKVISFKYTRSFHKNSYAFVVGKYVYNLGSGKRELKVSISLKYKSDTWYVDQINLN